MTTFALVALPIVVLILAVRHYQHIRRWIASIAIPFLFRSNASSPPTSTDVKHMMPCPARPIPGRERYRVMMDIRKLDKHNWLTLDQNYKEQHAVRDVLLRDKREEVIQCLPEAAAACQEALEVVAEFLCARYPSMFQTLVDGDTASIRNCMTGEQFAVRGPASSGDGIDALEAAVRLTMEDLSILMVNEEGEYYLAASASLFPTGWTVQERIGWTISRLHGPVPLWHQQVANSVSKFLARLTPNSPMERSNYFVEVKQSDERLIEILYRPQGLCEKSDSRDPTPSDILIRKERQTFRRLPHSETILFGVKTYLTPLDQLSMPELENLVREMKTWPDFVGEYKGKHVWGHKVLEYYQGRVRVAQATQEKLDV
ncbi:hypothetical protein N7539_002651 [Penicillium diatomitis]|uniref:Uncharacterized protein n=1 Tax=Penicillium diatomitis TaxID=2819901 RepID=A0A9X0BZ28_9EURO|nr:uncharacterized protein N7539_002651 [Penicillium diatomitis]KAJ5491084.1 hypothetical protein N7539_002651 [Penicillium diatomitis]